MTLFGGSKWRDPMLEAVLARLCEQRGDLWTTQAVKLPYLVDLVAKHVLGEAITHSHHKAWTYGVVTAKAWGMIKKGNGGDHFTVYGDPHADGLRIALETPPEEILTEEQRQIVDFVAAEFGDLGTGELGRLTKELNPGVEVWGSKEPVTLDDDAYRLLPLWFGELEADAQAAQARLDEIKADSSRLVSADGFLQALV